MDQRRKSSGFREPKPRVGNSSSIPQRERTRKSAATTQSQSQGLDTEGIELARLWCQAVLTIVWKHAPSLYSRICSWANDLNGEFEKALQLWDRETALGELRKKLASPVLLDHRRNKKTTDNDSKLLREYNNIVKRVRLLPQSHRRRELIRQALRKDFPEVDSPDFAPGTAPSETAYGILAARYTKGNIESLITRLTRARKRGRVSAYEKIRVAIALLDSAIAKSKDTEEKGRWRRAIQLIESGYCKVYGRKLEKLLPP